MPSPHWRTPVVVLICSGIILTLSLGTRHSFGLYLQPMTLDLGWSRETFAIGLALQNLVYGIATPFAGMVADKYGAARALVAGTILYALGMVMMAHASTGWEFSLSAGLLVGAGLSCSGFAIVFGVVGRAFPPQKRTVALGICSAAGSFGQFLMLPYGQTMINALGWQNALLICAATVMLIVPLSAALVETRKAAETNRQSIPEALREAFGHSGYVLLCSGYFVCGFQLAFIGIHMPTYLRDKNLSPEVAGYALALIGLFNVFGTYTVGLLGQKLSKPKILAAIYFARAVSIALFLLVPISPLSVYVFSAAMGFLWLSTVPATNAIVAGIFGVAHLSMLSGFVFLSHQVGSFLGVWLGGFLYDTTGSYSIVWYISIALGVFAALINLPVKESAIARGVRPAAVAG